MRIPTHAEEVRQEPPGFPHLYNGLFTRRAGAVVKQEKSQRLLQGNILGLRGLMFGTNTEDGSRSRALQDGLHAEVDTLGQRVDTTFGFFRDKMEGSTSTDTDKYWENGVTKTDENKVQDSDRGETSGGALDSWPSNRIEPKGDEEFFG